MPWIIADIAQEVECVLGKDEVTGSNPVISSRKSNSQTAVTFYFYKDNGI